MFKKGGMRKVLILTPFYPPNIGGAETFVKGLVDEAKKECSVTVLTFMPFNGKAQKYEEEYTKHGHLRVHRIVWSLSHAQAWSGVSFRNFLSVFPKMLVRAWWLHRKYKFDTIHAQGLIAGLVGVLIKGKAKMLITLLALYNVTGLKRILARFVLRKCDKIFVEGKGGEINAGNICGRWGRIKHFGHWCDHDKFNDNDTDRPLDKIRILFIGRPLPEKGMQLVQRAERELNDPNLEFEYVTKVEYTELPKIYKRNHVLCVPSLYDEGFSRVVVEGASCGCALLTTDRGSLPEQTEGWGASVPEERFTKALKTVIQVQEIMGAMSYAHSRDHYTKKNAGVFLNEY